MFFAGMLYVAGQVFALSGETSHDAREGNNSEFRAEPEPVDLLRNYPNQRVQCLIFSELVAD